MHGVVFFVSCIDIFFVFSFVFLTNFCDGVLDALKQKNRRQFFFCDCFFFCPGNKGEGRYFLWENR